MKKLVLESTAPFQGLPELVAYEEGLFAQEGVEVTWAERGEKDKADFSMTSHKAANPFSSHGALLEQGKADMYNACEWGNYCRAGATNVGSRQIGRRGIITYAAIVVRDDSPVYVAQQLAHRTVGVPFFAGTHYLALHLLEGFIQRDAIELRQAPAGSRYRLDALLRGEVDATTLTEPYITLAEKKGCRIICTGFYHGTEVASDKVDAETYAAFNRGVREAVKRISADKAKYLRYFIDYHAKTDPDMAMLKPEDLRASRLVVVDPAPIPDDELQRTYEWVKGWGMLEETGSALDLVNTNVQSAAHAAE